MKLPRTSGWFRTYLVAVLLVTLLSIVSLAIMKAWDTPFPSKLVTSDWIPCALILAGAVLSARRSNPHLTFAALWLGWLLVLTLVVAGMLDEFHDVVRACGPPNAREFLASVLLPTIQRIALPLALSIPAICFSGSSGLLGILQDRRAYLCGLLIAVLDTVLLLYLLMVGLTPDTFWLPGMEEDQSVPVVGTR